MLNDILIKETFSTKANKENNSLTFDVDEIQLQRLPLNFSFTV